MSWMLGGISVPLRTVWMAGARGGGKSPGCSSSRNGCLNRNVKQTKNYLLMGEKTNPTTHHPEKGGGSRCMHSTARNANPHLWHCSAALTEEAAKGGLGGIPKGGSGASLQGTCLEIAALISDPQTGWDREEVPLCLAQGWRARLIAGTLPLQNEWYVSQAGSWYPNAL